MHIFGARADVPQLIAIVAADVFHVKHNAHHPCECGYYVRKLCGDEKSNEMRFLFHRISVISVCYVCYVTPTSNRSQVFLRLCELEYDLMYNSNLFKRFAAISNGNASLVSFLKFKNPI